MITPEELRRRTDIALNTQRINKEKKLAEVQTIKYIERKRQELRAQKFINELDGKCAVAADLGKCECKLFTLHDDDLENPYSRVNLSAQLCGAAAIVWDQCKDLGFKPDIRNQHDGVGIRSWNEFWVSWEDPLTKKCTYIEPWIGKCGKENCKEHDGLLCQVCRCRPATRGCDNAGSLVCGRPLCEECKCHHG